MYVARIPVALLAKMKEVGLAAEKLVQMGGQVGREIWFHPEATKFVVDFFKAEASK